jgi:hypothetical protein
MLPQIGTLTFRLVGTVAAQLAEFEAQPIGRSVDGTRFRIAEGDETYLLLDHRRDSANPADRVEFWEVGQCDEASLSGLFALGDVRSPNVCDSEPIAFPALARMLRTGPAGPGRTAP